MTTEEIRTEITNVAPGSQEEAALLEAARATQRSETEEMRAVRREELAAAANEQGVVAPVAAREAASVAIQHTGEPEAVVPAKVLPPERP